MRNEYTQAEEQEYREAMHERWLEQQRQKREDALDALDAQGEDDDE
jgi:hypothetical protein